MNAKRSKRIKVRYWNMNGMERVEEILGYKAVIFQHEIDHMEGLTLHRFLEEQKEG